jgi:ectoine hydroxylase-related dioxygenase (phytanoyl-CoA dioxygenase family)
MQVRYQLRQRPVTATLAPVSVAPTGLAGNRVETGGTIMKYDPSSPGAPMSRNTTTEAGSDVRTLDDDAITTHAERVCTDGWSVVENAIALDLVDAIYDDLLRLERELGIVPADNLFEGTHTTRIYNLLVHGTLYERIPVYPNILPIVEKVLDPGLLVSSLSSIAIGPDEQAQPIHSDDQLIPLPKPHPPIICNTMWAITEFTEENGATRLCPGTHNADHSPNPLEHYPSIAAEMPKGAVLVWVGSLWHGGGANRTNTRRVGIAMNYCAGFMRQQENQQLGIPLSTLRAFPRRLQELCGFSIYNGLIGHIDKRHPGKLLLGTDQDSSLVWDYAKTPGS